LAGEHQAVGFGAPGARHNGLGSGTVRLYSGRDASILFTFHGDQFGDRFGSGLHLFWAAVFGALLIVVWRTLPRSYFAYCALALVLGLSASNLDSFERYCLSTFPFVLAVAVATHRRDVERSVFVLSSAGLFGYALLAFFGSWVP